MLVGIGGFIGAIFRYLISGLIPRIYSMPTGTLVVNVTGSTILSFFVISMPSDSVIHFVNIGMIGSFTTFSTFAYENFKFLEDGETRFMLYNILLNLIFCILGVGIGYIMGHCSVNTVYT
nr:CrcB family protein [Methanohalobium sp.]